MAITACFAVKEEVFEPRQYTVFDMKSTRPELLSTPARKLTFPLSAEDKRDVRILELQFDQEKNCAGLAAPQIGIAKQIIVFAAPDDPEIKKYRPDFTQTMAKTIWINPSFKGIEEAGFHRDYEACFSVQGVAGEVRRFNKIIYTAFDIHGKKVSGSAEGFLARIIQHEINHVEGVLFIDRAAPLTIRPIEELRAQRRKEG